LSASRCQVLVAEDEPGVLQLVSLALHEAGFTVLPCRTGAEAVAAYQVHHAAVAVALLDVQMAYPDGPQTLALLQEINPSVPCVFMSGSTGRYDPQELLALGACQVLQKPFSLADLVAAVRQAADSE
jgi:CheY-like chemotaxis protein